MVGSITKTLDEKNRIVIPSNFREELGEIFYISLGFDGVLEVRSKDEFDFISEKLSRGNTFNPSVQNLRRMFFGNTVEASCDKQGRVILPKNLLELAAIEKNVSLIGLGKKIEIWPAEKYEQQVAVKWNDKEELKKLQEELNNLGIDF